MSVKKDKLRSFMESRAKELSSELTPPSDSNTPEASNADEASSLQTARFPHEYRTIQTNDIHKLTQEIKTLELVATASAYLIGQRLNHIRNDKLYDQYHYTNDANEQVSCTSFTDYCTYVLHYSRRTAYNYLACFEFFSYEEAEQLGSLTQILLRSKENQSLFHELKEKALHQKMTYRELENTLKEKRLSKNSHDRTSSNRIRRTQSDRLIVNLEGMSEDTRTQLIQELTALIRKFSSTPESSTS